MTRWLMILICFAAPASGAEFNFCWSGAGGYTMTGSIRFPDAYLNAPIVTERDVTGFEITGYERGIAIGNWNLSERRPDTTWHLRFDPATLTFPTGGSFPGDQSQGWNANGDVTDCGDKGFGFNSGNYAQDLCLYGVWISQSSIEPETPFYATRLPVAPDCRGVDFIG